MTGTIFDIKEMALHDGPGIRTTVFFKGCPLRCRWCHNPEGLSSSPQLMYKEARCRRCGACQKACDHEACRPYGKCIYVCPENCLEIVGRQVSEVELAEELKASAEFLGKAFGGFTFSGGEPLSPSEFLFELSRELSDYPLCIETSGYTDKATFLKMLDAVDFVIMDIKLAESEAHEKYTGASNVKILENFKLLKASGKPYVIRTPLVPGVTDTEENLKKISEIIGDSDWERLPYNEFAPAKYKMLGMDFSL